MAGMPVVVASTTAVNSGVNTLTFTKPSGVQAGDILVAALRSQSAVSTADWACSGFARIGVPFTSADAAMRVTGFYRHVITDPGAEPSTYVFSGLTGSGQRNAGALLLIRGSGDPVDLDSYQTGKPGTSVTNGRRVGSYTTTGADRLLLFLGANEIVAPNASAPVTTPSGYTLIQDVHTSENTAISRTVAWVAKKEQAAAGATGTAEITWASAASAVGLSIALYAPGDPPPAAIQLERGDESLVSVTVYDGTDEVPVVGVQAIPPALRSYTVAQMEAEIAADKTVYWAHRGGSLDWAEMTMRAFTNAVWWGARALEVSCRVSSDGVYIMSHDSTTDRVTATSYSLPATASSVLLGIPVDTPVAGGVLGRLEDLLAAYPDFVILADRKATGSWATFGPILKTVPDWQQHVIVKFDGQYDKATGSAAHDEGFKTAAYFWDTNYAAHYASVLPYTDYLGLNYDADQAIWDTFIATGKTLWGHVCPTLAAANTAIAKGAQIVQCAGVKAIIPQVNAVS